MKLLRYGAFREEKPAVLRPDGRAFDVSSVTRDFDSDFFEGGGLARLKEAVAKAQLPVVELQGKRIGSPVARPYKILGVGLNYADHAKESNMPIPPNCSLVLAKGPSVTITFPLFHRSVLAVGVP